MDKVKALLNSLIGRLFVSYIVIILIVCIASYISHGLIYNILEDRLIKENRTEFENIVEDCEKYLNSVKNHLIYIDMDNSFQRLVSPNKINDYSIYKISTYMGNKNIEAPKHTSCWVYHSESDYIITGSTSYPRTVFWNTFYHSEKYNKAFWDERFTTIKQFEILPPEFFADRSFAGRLGGNSNGGSYMTLIYKSVLNNSYYLFAFIDTDRFLNQINSQFSGKIQIEPGVESNGVSGLEVAEGIYRMSYFSDRHMINYYTDIDYRSIRQQLNEINFRFTVIVVLSIFLCVLFSLIFSIKINTPFKNIGSIFESLSKDKKRPTPFIDLEVLKNNIFSLVQVNLRYKSEIENRDKRLQKYMFLDKIRNPDIPDLVSDTFRFNSENGFHLLCIKIHLLGEALQNKESGSEVYSAYNKKLNGYFEGCSNYNIIYFSENKESFIIIYEPDKYPVEYLVDRIKKYLDSIRNDHACFSVLAGVRNHSLDNLDKIYDNVLMLQEKRLLGRDTCVIYEDNPQNNSEHYVLSINDIQDFSASVSKGYINESITILSRILESNKNRRIGCFRFSMLCYEMVNLCIKAVIDTYSFLPDGVDSLTIYTRLKGLVCFDDFANECIGFMKEIEDAVGETNNNSDYIVEYIVKYIGLKYNEEIYLDLFSEKLNVSKVYISKHFKEVTGVNLLDYINKYRMEIACEKLKNTDMKIKDIACAVGISNINSFIRIFKKYYGKSPGEYRNYHLILQ